MSRVEPTPGPFGPDGGELPPLSRSMLWSDDETTAFLVRPRRSDPSLAAIVRRCNAGGDRHLPGGTVQLEVCLEVARRVTGWADPAVVVFETACGGDPRLGSEALLTAALGLHLFDGVVVAGLGVLQVDEYPLFHFRASMLLGSCELYVAGRPDVTLWGPQAVGFEPMVRSSTALARCGGHGAGFLERAAPASVGAGWGADPFSLLRAPVWPEVGHRDAARLWQATMACRFGVDVIDADLEREEEAVLDAVDAAGRRSALARLSAVSDRYLRARLELLILQRLAEAGGVR